MAASERRHAFRVDDQVHLSLKVSDELGDENSEQVPSEVADMVQRGLSTLRELNFQSGHILAGIRKSQPEISQYLSLMDRKITILTQLAASAHYGTDVKPNIWINLSARGMAFDLHENAYAVEDKLLVQMMLFPSYSIIEANAHVVSIRNQAKGGKQGNYRVALLFDSISESQREVLLRHITERQSEQLRMKRFRNQR
jgi:hypothetical protein